MKTTLGCAVLALTFAFTAVSADAKGCIKGAVAGSVAGHAAGHGALGALAGCVIGRHAAKKNENKDNQNPPQ
jgi:hypothetical protein